MKKHLFFFLLITSLSTATASGLDLKGIQPLSPYGIFSTFSTDSLKKGKAGISLGFERSLSPDFYRLTTQLGYGITDSLELDVTIPYDWGNSDITGFEDTAFTLKHRILNEGKYWPSIAYIISASLNSGKNELSTEGSIGGGIILSKRIGPVNTHANILYFRPGSSNFTDDITFALGLDFSAAYNVHVLAELYGKKSYAGKIDRLEARLGYRLVTADSFFTTLGAGFDMKNRSPEFRLLLTFSYIFPQDKKPIQRIIEEEE